MSEAPLRVERRGGTVIWTLARPEAKNALSMALFAALSRAVEAVSSELDVRSVILTGEGDAFCAGGDLRELRDKNTAEEILPFARAGEELCARMEALPMPIIAALPGLAFGGGAELAMACDLRVADAQARLSFKQVRMGVTTAWGTIPRLVAAVGGGAAARLLYTADEVTAGEALSLGLIDAVSEDGQSLATALGWADAIAQGAPGAVAAMKALLRASREGPSVIAEEERTRFLATWTSDEHREALAAYFERRNPAWSKR